MIWKLLGMPRWFYFLLIFAPLAVILDLIHVPPLLLFVAAALGIVPLAALIGQGVEGVAEHTGERIGGLLFATFGNATELIISILALRDGLVDVVRASIIGTILGNALLVLGVAVCVGGFKHGRLMFETRPASQYASLLALCVGGLVLPTIAQLHLMATQQTLLLEHNLSAFVAVLLLIGYLASIVFSVFRFRDHGGDTEMTDVDPLRAGYSMGAITPPAQPHAQKVPLWRALVLLTTATIAVAVLSEILVGAIEPVTKSLGWNEAFVGLVFIPLIGGLPEYFNTISMALDKRIGMVLAASAGSSIQIALLVAPLLVLISLLTPKRLDLVFSIVELAVLGITTFLFSEITKDGELVWLEGLLLILLFGMMAGTVFTIGA